MLKEGSLANASSSSSAFKVVTPKEREKFEGIFFSSFFFVVWIFFQTWFKRWVSFQCGGFYPSFYCRYSLDEPAKFPARWRIDGVQFSPRSSFWISLSASVLAPATVEPFNQFVERFPSISVAFPAASGWQYSVLDVYSFRKRPFPYKQRHFCNADVDNDGAVSLAAQRENSLR